MVATVLLVVYYVGFLVLPPLIWWAPLTRPADRAWPPTSCSRSTFFPLHRRHAFWLWVYVAVRRRDAVFDAVRDHRRRSSGALGILR